MLSQIMSHARDYEKTEESGIDKKLRPGFHLCARVGWMNDPNGFSFYQGEYHLFYQYHPYSCQWGPMHWGHAVSKDLLHWKYLPAALAPDTEYDKDGCFSGSAAVLADGRHLLMYTGVVKKPQADGSVREVQTQCIAFGDGREYEKYAGNPVLAGKDLPTGSNRFEFRDPKIWQKADGTYRCVAGNCTQNQDGQILLFSSQDGIRWKYEKILVSNKGRYGKMWECPDFFALDKKQVLFVSPQYMLPQGLEYNNGNGTVCLIGSFDVQTEEFIEQADQAIDYGIDFYAPQTMLAPDGRRIMIGWMQNWDTCSFYRAEQLPWFGQMSLPRELSIKEGRLIQKPVRELEKLRRNKVLYENLTFSGMTKLDGIAGRRIDMELSIRPTEGLDIFKKFAVCFAQKGTQYTSFSFRPEESIVKIDRKFSGSRRAAVHERCCLVKQAGGRITLRMILDSYSVEIFVNDGEHVLSTTIYTDTDADAISFFAEGEATMDVVKYDLITDAAYL